MQRFFWLGAALGLLATGIALVQIVGVGSPDCSLPDGLGVAEEVTDIKRRSALRKVGYDDNGEPIVQIECSRDANTVEAIEVFVSLESTSPEDPFTRGSFVDEAGDTVRWVMHSIGVEPLPWNLRTTSGEIAIMVRLQSRPEEPAALLQSVLPE